MPSERTAQENPEELQRKIAELQAQLASTQAASVSGSGAVAQGSGDALGERGVKVGGNARTIVTGTQIVTNYYASSGAKLSKEEIARQVTGYLRWLKERCGRIELRGIERAGGAKVVVLPLETAYVALRARAFARMGHDEDVGLDQVLDLGNRLAIIGGPGCGKTTVLLHMAWALASSLLAGEPEPARSRLGLTMAPADLPLPILVPLASFARTRRSLPPGAPPRHKTLAHFISHHLISKEADFDLPDDFFVQLLQDGRNVLLLLDGLDEVADEQERAEVRQSVENLVGGREGMRVVVTCRTVAYRSGRTALGANFREIDVQPLDPEQHIAPMIRQAYACIYPDDGESRTRQSDDLLQGIARLEQERRVRLGDAAEPLVHSPLMVRLLLIVHFNNRRLPDERADLFDKAVNALLQVDYGPEESDIRELAADWKLYRDMAQHLAFHMHRQGPDQGREIEEEPLRRSLAQDPEFGGHIDDFLAHARQRGSVLEERGGAFRFIHLAFQEFLVARYLKEVVGGESREAILTEIVPRLAGPWWREPILLLGGYMAIGAARSAREFLRALAVVAGADGDARFSAAELAGTTALEWRESGEAIRGECAGRIVELLRDGNALARSKPVIRARAGDALARLGDPRFDPQHFHLPADDMLGFVHIPADPQFRIGTRKADAERVAKIVDRGVGDDEINDEPTPSPEFYICRYPVTVAQFRAFAEASGFRIGREDALRDPDSRPVRFVNWYEAQAYCEWLNGVLASAPEFEGTNAGRLVREHARRVALPSELEWERAARGGLRDAIYSWGDEPDPNRGNYSDSEIGDTSAVGCFPANGFGLYDMIGNVWEWTRSRFADYPYAPADGREEPNPTDDEPLVLRGGSWYGVRDSACCAYRLWSSPGSRFDSLGFRVVLRSSPVR
jgi:formylglycine-generating enzyme required for sulfatase activity